MAGEDGGQAYRGLISAIRGQHLQWFPELGLGYFPVAAPAEEIYDDAYFEKYRSYSDTAMGRRLTSLRVALVRRHHPGRVLDIGIGAGDFILAHGRAEGFDIAAPAVRWLKAHQLFADVTAGDFEALTFWDSLEHIHEFPRVLARARRYVFVSMPVFEGPEHVLRSRHYRRDEHCWYFTAEGFLRLMARLGWVALESNDRETRAGRADIASFAFKREG